MRRGTSTDVTSTKPRVDVPDVRVVVWFGIVFCVCDEFYDSAKVFGTFQLFNCQIIVLLYYEPEI